MRVLISLCILLMCTPVFAKEMTCQDYRNKEIQTTECKEYIKEVKEDKPKQQPIYVKVYVTNNVSKDDGVEVTWDYSVDYN